jgi:hypothetical protein
MRNGLAAKDLAMVVGKHPNPPLSPNPPPQKRNGNINLYMIIIGGSSHYGEGGN